MEKPRQLLHFPSHHISSFPIGGVGMNEPKLKAPVTVLLEYDLKVICDLFVMDSFPFIVIDLQRTLLKIIGMKLITLKEVHFHKVIRLN